MSFLIRKKLSDIPESIYPVMTDLAVKYNAINLAQGFPGYRADEELLKLVDKYILLGKNQYAPIMGVLELRTNLANKISEIYGRVYNPGTEICITAGATQGIFTAVSAIVNKDDEVIIIDPAFESYEPVVKFNGGKVKRSPLKSETFEIDWKDIQSKVTDKTRMLIINTPQNPTGKVFSIEDIQNLRKIVSNTNIIVLSDEVYEHIVFDGKKHESISKYPDLAERSILVYSLGKTYHITGWRLGYVCAPEELMKEFVRAHQYQVYSVSTPLQYAVSEYLLLKEKYLELSQFFQEKRDFFLKCLKGSKFVPLECSGSYFQLLNYSSISNENDVDFAIRLTKENKVASIPISVFYEDKRQSHLLRFCFAKDLEDLERGAEKLHKF
ncbi:MAG: methionine aminotransferase [Flavobacteriales bacterium]|nr:methionine aminotransferase [Flavobacteriales bacterium]|tara:strand:+ start:7037 stop:8185 length:1149 start_codon:yes stop_codon:yes gene_type:complete